MNSKIIVTLFSLFAELEKYLINIQKLTKLGNFGGLIKTPQYNKIFL